MLILAGTIGHVLSLGASSFIEEEHQTWYFLINTLCLALCQELCRNHFLLKECDLQLGTTMKQNFDSIGEASECKNIDVQAASNSKLGKAASSAEFVKGSDKWISLASPWIILICCRLLRSLNQTGVQWAHRPDFGHWLTRWVTDLFSYFLCYLEVNACFVWSMQTFLYNLCIRNCCKYEGTKQWSSIRNFPVQELFLRCYQ